MQSAFEVCFVEIVFFVINPILISTPPITTNPQVFNELLLQTSGLIKLRANQLIADNSTKQDINQRIEKLENSIKEPLPKLIDLIKENPMLVKEIF